MLRRFAIELLNEVAEECDERSTEGILFAEASEVITDFVITLVEFEEE